MLVHLYLLKLEFENAFYVLLKKRDPKIFAFLNDHQVHFPINPNLGKLLKIDAIEATRYWLDRHARFFSTQAIIIKSCVSYLGQSSNNLSEKKKREADLNVHLFLDAVFEIDKELSRPYHDLQVELYI